MKGCETRNGRTGVPRARTLARAGALLLAAATLGACEADTLFQTGEDGGIETNLTPLSVAVQTTSSPRMERTDSLKIEVRATDSTGKRGVAEVGATALVTHADGSTSVLTRSSTYDAASTSSATPTFAFALPIAPGDLSLPDTLGVEAYGWAVDGQGNCVASTSAAGQRLSCGDVSGATVALDATGQTSDVIAVRGQTVDLPSEGRIADAMVDPARSRLYLSNLTKHHLEVLDLTTHAFRPFVEVGSEPWGLGMSRNNDTLFVANSGGTSISYVSLNALTEDVGRRLKTPNEVLYDVTVSLDPNFNTRYLPHYIDFSDRPEFLAQDYTGRILYSTLPTEVAPLGTIRWVDPNPDPASSTDVPEVRFLFTTDAITPSEVSWAFAQIDSLHVLTASGQDDHVQLFDHVPGHPSQLIQSDVLLIPEAITSIRSRGSDIIAAPGTWNTNVLGFSDTTYVSLSGDRHWVAFGEGNRAPAGRIVLFDAARNQVSRAISVTDLVNNASEKVNGVDINYDGSFGVARGDQAAYFFDSDLRLQGVYEPGVPGGAGAALQPGSVPTLPKYAFVGSSENTVKAIDTTHFLLRAEVPIRDNIVGPLRASGPLPGENAGLSCGGSPDPGCIVAKIYGITSGGGVVIVNILAADLQ